VETARTLSDRLRKNLAAIGERWLGGALAVYSEGARDAFHRQRDPFANPVGHALRVGMQAALQGLAEGRDPEEIGAALDEVVKIRAVQEFPPSRAIAFVFLLKEAVRVELGKEDGTRCDAALAAELAELDGRIDQVALRAFDAYVRFRGQICELRINEVKRNVAAIVERLNRHRPSPETGGDPLPSGTSNGADAQRGDGR
jgi:hypothetical protein